MKITLVGKVSRLEAPSSPGKSKRVYFEFPEAAYGYRELAVSFEAPIDLTQIVELTIDTDPQLPRECLCIVGCVVNPMCPEHGAN